MAIPTHETTTDPNRSIGQPSMATMEFVVALVLIGLGALVSFDSWRLGARWSDLRGPGAGYFPFWLGLCLILCGASILVRTFRLRARLRVRFIELHQLYPVLTILLPTIGYVAAMQWLGFYVASILFVSCFMRFAGNIAWWKCLLVSSLPMIGVYWVFKRFGVLMLTGPVEAWLQKWVNF